VPNLSIPTMTDFATTALERGSTIRTDGLSSYRGLVAAGYRHQVITLKAVEEPAHVAMPAVHRVASLLQRWLLGTHQGAVRVHHLDYYLDEFTFRFNRRGARHRGLLFFRLSPASRRHPPGHRRSAHGKASQHVGVTGVKRIGRFVNG